MKTLSIFLLFGAPLFQAGDPVAFTPRQSAGDVFEETETFWRSSAAALEDPDGNRASFEARGARDAELSVLEECMSDSKSTILDEVLSAVDGKRVKVKRTFVASSSTIVDSVGGESIARSKTAAFEGQTILLVAEGEGIRIEGELDGEEELDPSDLALSSRWEEVLPRMPVAAGDTWSLSEDVSKSLLKGIDMAKATAWCTFDGVDERAPGKPAKIKLEVRATTSAGPLGAELSASGWVSWSTAFGRLLDVTVSGEIRSAGPSGVEEKSKFGFVHEMRRVQ